MRAKFKILFPSCIYTLSNSSHRIYTLSNLLSCEVLSEIIYKGPLVIPQGFSLKDYIQGWIQEFSNFLPKGGGGGGTIILS